MRRVDSAPFASTLRSVIILSFSSTRMAPVEMVVHLCTTQYAFARRGNPPNEFASDGIRLLQDR